MVKYTLHYFDGRGNAEIIRQIFAVAKQEYEDHRIPKDQWPAFKEKTPFGQVPVLEEDGKQLAQTHAIARYLAKKFGLAGKTPLEEAQVDSFADLAKDIQAEIRPFFLVAVGFAEGDLEKLKADVLIPAIKKAYGFLTKFLKENGSGYLVGKSLTWVDLLIAESTAGLAAKAPEALDNYPEVKAHMELVHSNPEVKHWRETRPKTPF